MIRRAAIVAALAVACTPPPGAETVGGGETLGEVGPASHGPIPTADHGALISGSLAEVSSDEPSQTTMPIPTTTLPPAATTPHVHIAASPVGHVQRRVAETWPEDPQTALSVAGCESGYDTTETGRAGERGVMQIHPVHRPRIRAMGYRWDDMYQLEPNLTVARAIWSESGWGPWTCAR